MASPDDHLLTLLSQSLREELGSDFKLLTLFGSRARGDYTPDSDYDCLLVVSEVTPAVLDVIDRIAGELLYTYDVVFSIIPISARRYRSERYHPLLRTIAQEGVTL
jgi:predicted nucleotidyltransferase